MAVKLAISVGVALALMVFLGAFSLGNLRLVNDGVDRTYNDRIVPMKGLKVISDMYAVNGVDMVHKVVDGAVTFDEGMAAIKEARKRIDEEWEKYLATTLTAEESKLVEEAKPLKEAGNRLLDRIAETMASGQKQALAEIASRELYPVIEPITERIYSLIELQMRVAGEEKEASTVLLQKSIRTTVFVVGFALILTFGIGWAVAKGITGPTREIGDALTAFQQGRVDVDVTYRAKDELGVLAEQFRFLLAKLRDTVAWAKRIADGRLALEESEMNVPETDILGRALLDTALSLRNVVESASQTSQELSAKSQVLAQEARNTSQVAHEVASSVDDLTQASSESARSSTEIAAGSEQLAKTATEAANVMVGLLGAIDQVQTGSRRQADAAKDAAGVAAEGGRAVEATIDSMSGIQAEVAASAQVVRELGEKQEQIGAIVAAIEDIASQTNLLALNAAIEAARAGEQGRGFAVVADEVRKLAERAGNATTEIAQLIAMVRTGVGEAITAMDRSTEQVRVGAEHSADAKTALVGILTSIRAVSEIADENVQMTERITNEANLVEAGIGTVAGVSEETAAAAQQMSANSQQVAASTTQVAQAIQRQSKSVAEVSRIASELDAITHELSDVLARFELGDDSSRPKLRAA